MDTPKEEIESEKRTLSRTQWFFIIFCAGAERNIIEDCPTGWQTHVSLGATVLFTGLFAWISGGYALYSVFREIAPAVFFGFFWGLVIFNVDRYIVSTFKKLDEETSWRRTKEFLNAVPRIILALIIAITIAVPLEVKIFEERLKDTREQKKHEAIKRNKEETYSYYTEDMDDWAKRKKELEDKINKIDEELESTEDPVEVRNHLRDELNEVNKTIFRYEKQRANNIRDIQQIEHSGDNSSRKNKLLEENNALQKTINAWWKKNDEVKRKISETKEEYYKNKKEERKAAKEELEKIKEHEYSARTAATAKIEARNKETDESFSNNFVAQLEALGELSTGKNKAMLMTSIMITLLFLTIELTPIFAKLITRRNSYDERDERIEYEYRIRQRRENEIARRENEALIAKANEKINTELRIYKKKIDEWEKSESKPKA